MRAVFAALVGAFILASSVADAFSLRRVPSRRLQTYTGTGTIGDSFTGSVGSSEPLIYEFTGLAGSNLPAQVRLVPQSFSDDPDLRISCDSNPVWDVWVANSAAGSGQTDSIVIPSDFNDASSSNIYRNCPFSTAYIMVRGFGGQSANFDLHFEASTGTTDDPYNFHNDFVLNDDNVATAAAGIATGIIVVIILANVIFWTALICIIYHCCCKTRQQTIIVQRPGVQANPAASKPAAAGGYQQAPGTPGATGAGAPGGYPQASGGYPATGAPAPGYGAPAPGYGAPQQGTSQPYQTPPAGYPAPSAPGYPAAGAPGYPVAGAPGYPASSAPYPTASAPYPTAGYPASSGYPAASAPPPAYN